MRHAFVSSDRLFTAAKTLERCGTGSASPAHSQCVNRWLSGALGGFERLPETRFYYWAATDRLLAKICKPRGQCDATDPIEHARAAFVRGSIFAPSIHLRWEPIPCVPNAGRFCHAAVIMRRLPSESRLDRAWANACESGRAGLIELLFESQRRAIILRAPAGATTESSLIRSDQRIMKFIGPRLEAGGRNLLQLWRSLCAAREPLMDEIRRRDRQGACSQTHGDLAADNLYVEGGEVHRLDPCIAFRDLFELDSAIDWAHLIVTLGSVQPQCSSAVLIERAAIEAGTSHDLMEHYVARIALTRVTMRELGREQLGNRELRGTL
jgi:hypothetical protein